VALKAAGGRGSGGCLTFPGSKNFIVHNIQGVVSAVLHSTPATITFVCCKGFCAFQLARTRTIIKVLMGYERRLFNAASFYFY